MEREAVKKLFGDNFIGEDELRPLLDRLGFHDYEIKERNFPFDDACLKRAAAEGYILIWCVTDIDGQEITIRFLREKFGINPDISEPCFYNQDWYLSELFVDIPLNEQWYLIKKSVLDETRAVQPSELSKIGFNFPPAILCLWTFFAYYFAKREYLWYHDFVWCSDLDHNGDRIYVGKYHDIDGVNKNGFSVHRHLALRHCYGSIDYIE